MIDSKHTIRVYPGWVGVHTRDEALGALPNGTRVRKTKNEPGDAHPIGSFARILGSIHVPEYGYGYFVEWEDAPRVAVMVVQAKIEKV